MNMHDRIETTLRREYADQVPFTIYRNKIPQGEAERRLREKGLGFSWRQDVLRWEHPHCDVESVSFSKNGEPFSRTTWSTPVGEVSELWRHGGEYNTAWQMEWPVKSREDYRVMEFAARDAVALPAYDAFNAAVDNVGGDGYVVGHFGYSPLMTMIVNLIGFENAAYHMADWPDEFWSLYDALNEKARRGYKVVARSPAHVMLYCGNVHPGVLGRDRFARYVVPCYNEMADVLHEEGKLLAVHFDANNAHWADLITSARIDVIEAFTPPPDCDMSVADARRLWGDRVLWLNFPSSVHLAEPDVIRSAALDILRQSGDGRGVIMGITENIPDSCWAKSLSAIADTLNEFGRLPLRLP